MADSYLIETGIDKLIAIVEERGRVALPKVAREMGVSPSVVEGWVKFLEEEDLVTIEYSLTIPYLVYKKLSKRDILRKAKEFKSKKDVFLNKASVTLNFLEKEGERLKKSKTEFDKLKKELGYEIEKVKDELSELEKYDKLKSGLDRKLADQKKSMEESLQKYSAQLKEEQTRYGHLIKDIDEEEQRLIEEERDSLALEEQEKKLLGKIDAMKDSIKEIETRIRGKEEVVGKYRKHIYELQGTAKQIKKDIEYKSKAIVPMIDETKAREKDIDKMQQVILKKLSSHKKDVNESRLVTQKFQKFFDQNLKISELLTQINKDRDDLEKSLQSVIRKAQAFQITGRDKDVAKNLIELEKMFGEVEKKKSFFEEELLKLKSLIGK